MTSRDFCYWLQGYFEISNTVNADTLSHIQVRTIQSHLAMVFAHEIDPSAGSPAHQAELNQIHTGKPQEHFLKPQDPGHLPGHPGSGVIMRC